MSWLISPNLKQLRRRSLVGQIVLLALAVEMLFFGSFCPLELPTATASNLERFAHLTFQNVIYMFPERMQERALLAFPELEQPVGEIRYSPYVAMAPLAVLAGYALGLPIGVLACLIFFLLGLAADLTSIAPFAAGGGLDYYRQPGFGYLIGMIACAWFASRITLVDNTSVRQLAAVAGGLFLLHTTGLVYMIGSSLLVLALDGDKTVLAWQPWLFEQARNLTWYALPYDFFFSLVLIGIGSPFRWLAETLTAPDIGFRPKPAWKVKFRDVLQHR